jgi:3-phosphoshikimate 1-carboxyvinyltransferase
MFNFVGQIQSSKSIFNRALVVQSYFPELNIIGHSLSADVVHLDHSLKNIQSEYPMNVGMGGTTFRFLSLRASRINKESQIQVHPRLLERPQEDLWNLFDQLGINYKLNHNQIILVGQNWDLKNKIIQINCEKSTQFASAFLLNCWLLPTDVQIQLSHVGNSRDYLEMTIQFLIDLGMRIEINRNSKNYELRIPAYQKIDKYQYVVEPDMSSVATLAIAGVINGAISIEQFPGKSLQPDFQFLNYFKLMNIHYEISHQEFKIQRQDEYEGVILDLQQTPDLFPCLAILAAFAKSPSQLRGVPQLIHKESNRLLKTVELLNYIGCEVEVYDDGIQITKPVEKIYFKNYIFNPDHDHRMAMAAGLLKLKKYPIQIKDAEVIQKSFVDYFEIIGVTP